MADTTGHLYVYGDSYSDIRDGNQKSNGPLWSERLADRWGLQLKSLAEQGARACPSSATSVVSSSFSSLADQVQQRTTSSASQDVHAIFIGVTDVVNTKEKLEAEALRDCVKQQIFNIQQTDANARILLFGLPPLEFSPYYAKEPSKIKGRIMEYNAALEDMVNDWDSVNGATASLSYVDLSTLFGAVLGDPSEYRLLDVENAYWDKCQGRCNDPVNNYLWWDAIHITGGGHKAIADAVLASNPFHMAIGPDKEYPVDASDNTDLPVTEREFFFPFTSWLILAGLMVMILLATRPARIANVLKRVFKKTPSGYVRAHSHESLPV